MMKCFRFHKAPQIIRAAHLVQERMHVFRDDRAFRVVLTVADQAIQGPGSVRFTPKEREIDGLLPDPLAEAACKFHIVDGVGCHTDSQYQETIIFDRLLRLIRCHFAFGVGILILKDVGANLGELAQAFERHAAAVDAQATKA